MTTMKGPRRFSDKTIVEKPGRASDERYARRGGGDFGAGGAAGVRLTFATSAEILGEMLDRMADAVRRQA